MARKRKKRKLLGFLRLPSLNLDSDTKKSIFIIFILALGALSLLGLFDKAAIIGIYLKDTLTYLFGWGKWLIPFVLLGWGYILYNEEKYELGAKNYIGSFLFLVSFHAFLFMFIETASWESAQLIGDGGGFIGLLLANTLIKLMGYIASLLITFCLVIISIIITFDTSLTQLFGADSFFAKLMFPFNFLISKIFRKKVSEEQNGDEEEENEEEGEEENNEEEEDGEEEEEEENGDEEEENEEEGEEENNEEEEDGEEEEEAPLPAAFLSKPVTKTIEELWWQKPTGINIDISLGLLESKKGKPHSGDVEKNKEIIRRTLENFSIPVEMGEISIGPTVTQYTLKPAEGVKLSKITNLNNDLAMALAAHPIRIEAPIPGKALVGIEVPNQTKAIVGFKEILSSKNYNERKTNMLLALGKDVAGNTWLSDITRMPHLLVAGATNSGKSVCLNTIIVSLMYQNNPDNLRFIMVDPKRVELTTYDRTPYLLTPVITDVPKTINALKWCLNEMDKRYDVLNKVHTKNIQAYNEIAKIKMPYIVFVIDELADLMVTAAKDIEGAIIRLAQMARAVGIHLILATQRPSVDVITGLIKANMPARIAFSVASGTDSRTILDTLGAEKLLGRGDMLFQTAELSKPVRLQGAYLSDNEIAKITKYVIKKGGEIKYLENITERQKVSGTGGIGLDGTVGDEDELLEEAKEIVINGNKASTSFLQRRLRIGYARAASIMDQLEELGIIGSSNGAKAREILISKEQYASLDQQVLSGTNLHNRKESVAPENYLGAEDIPGSTTIFSNVDNSSDKDENEEDEEISEDEDTAEKIKKNKTFTDDDDIFFSK